MEDKISLMPIQALHTAAPFKTIFPIKESVLNEIAEDMKQNGFDYAHPIIIWGGHKVTVVDGHTRLAAAQQIHLNKVPITLKEFADEDEALQYAIRAQRNRRNLSDAELLNCLAELDKRKHRGIQGNSQLATGVANGKSAEKTAELLGVSRGKIEKLRTVNDHAPDRLKAAVSRGDISINKAYNETMKQRRAEEAQAMEAPIGEALLKLKESRMETIRKSIVKMVVASLEREVHEYPEIRYTLAEKNGLGDTISNEIGKLIAAMLPGENEDEQ